MLQQLAEEIPRTSLNFWMDYLDETTWYTYEAKDLQSLVKFIFIEDGVLDEDSVCSQCHANVGFTSLHVICYACVFNAMLCMFAKDSICAIALHVCTCVQ